MVTGELPFGSNGPLEAWMKKVQNDLTPPRKLVPELSERLDWAIRRAMASQADHRPVSCREFVEDLTGHSTRRMPTTENNAVARRACGIWSTRTRRANKHTVKGSTSAIRRSLKEGLLGDAGNVRASRSKAGPFEALQAYPEFRDLILALPGDEVDARRGFSVRGAGRRAEHSRRPNQIDAPPGHGVSWSTPARAGRRGRSSRASHLLKHEAHSQSHWDWLTWLGLIALAVGSALAAYYLIPDQLFRR